MVLTPRQLNRATLERQLLLRREPLTVVDGLRRVVALQAQQPASPYIALWNRLAGFDPAELDRAFDDRSVVKATLMRITLHAVIAEDYPVFHEAMLPSLRAAGLGDRRFTSTGLSAGDADALVPHLLELAARPRTKAELEAMLTERLGRPPGAGLWRALRIFAPLVHAPTDGPWSFGHRPSFVAAPAEPARIDRERSVQRLIWRYLEGFGPAAAEDFARFTMHSRRSVREALRAMSDVLTTHEGPGGAVLFDVPHGTVPAEDVPAPPRLMGMWDSVLLAYADRSRVIPDEYRPLVIRRNGDVLATVLVDGHVAGVWRPVDGSIEVQVFRPMPEDAWRALGDEARSLMGMLAHRDPAVYGRYAHWWSTLPSAETRLLQA